MSGAAAHPLLRIEDLSIGFRRNRTRAIRGVSFDIRAGEIVALVGESGSGKSSAGMAIMGLLDRAEVEISGSITLERKVAGHGDLLGLSEREMCRVRGNDVAMIFQEPMSSLDPIFTVGQQIGEAIAAHRDKDGHHYRDDRAIRAEALRLLDMLAIPGPEKCFASYPHQLSGGMRQRVMIAIALSCRPKLLIADEPTTALDATIQAQIVDQLALLQRETGMAVLFITHDLGLAAEIADRVLVLYAGQIVEAGPIKTVFGRPMMPYTVGLMLSRPQLGMGRAAGGRIEPIPGGVPDLAALPAGCAFHPRCPHAQPGLCDASEPVLEPAGPDRLIRCARWREVAA